MRLSGRSALRMNTPVLVQYPRWIRHVCRLIVSLVSAPLLPRGTAKPRHEPTHCGAGSGDTLGGIARRYTSRSNRCGQPIGPLNESDAASGRSKARRCPHPKRRRLERGGAAGLVIGARGPNGVRPRRHHASCAAPNTSERACSIAPQAWSPIRRAEFTQLLAVSHGRDAHHRPPPGDARRPW